MTWAADLEAPLDEAPRFFVEPVPALRQGSELSRQVTFRKAMRQLAPLVVVEANANAGKRNPANARREGIVAGVFDLTVTFRAPLIAWIEFKGFDAKGRPGKLSQAQIEFGNRRGDLGWHVACFYDPWAAITWLRLRGFPVAEARAA